MGVEATVAVGPAVRAALDCILAERAGIGSAPLFPSPEDLSRPLDPQLADCWLLRVEELAGLPDLPGGRWHAFRRNGRPRGSTCLRPMWPPRAGGRRPRLCSAAIRWPTRRHTQGRTQGRRAAGAGAVILFTATGRRAPSGAPLARALPNAVEPSSSTRRPACQRVTRFLLWRLVATVI